jgi:hypothetical protein
MAIRDRIKELRRVPARELRPSPRNWRTHPETQRQALRGVLAEVGYAAALLARELEDGSLELIDGHLRAETTPDEIVPVLVLDVDAAEADKILLTHDPLAAMANVDQEQLAALVDATTFGSPEVDDLLAGLVDEAAAAVAWESPSDRPEVDIPESYQVVVECASEADQQAVFARMKKAGYRCRVLTL